MTIGYNISTKSLVSCERLLDFAKFTFIPVPDCCVNSRLSKGMCYGFHYNSVSFLKSGFSRAQKFNFPMLSSQHFRTLGVSPLKIIASLPPQSNNINTTKDPNCFGKHTTTLKGKNWKIYFWATDLADLKMKTMFFQKSLSRQCNRQ